MDTDIFQRTLCCHPLEKKAEEIDIFEAEPEECSPEEEHEISIEEEPLDKIALMAEVDCMKRRIQVIQLRLKGPTDECPVEECADFEVLLNCSENKEICALQKNHHKLQCQINELIKCCRAANDHIQDLHFRFCEKARQVEQLQKHVAVLMQWKTTLDHEFGKCLERFEYLKHVKAEWKDVTEKLEEQKRCYTIMEKAFVPKLCFLQEKKSFICAISEIKEMIKELYDNQLKHFDSLERRFEHVTSGR